MEDTMWIVTGFLTAMIRLLRGAWFCRGCRARSKIGGLAMKGGQTAPQMAKNNDGGMIFYGWCGAHRPLSGAETLVTWSSAVPLPRCPMRVGFRRQQGGQMATASLSITKRLYPFWKSFRTREKWVFVCVKSISFFSCVENKSEVRKECHFFVDYQCPLVGPSGVEA